ncbi:MAG: MFS transporter, partial [Candidatus Hermodarchaeota archaeon]
MEKKEIEIIHSKKSMASYGFGKFVNEFLNLAFGAYVFFYYETEIGLNVWLTALGYIIFALWNAINDPLLGYLTDRPFKFTKKWGRRFPWVYIGGIPYIISYILVFIPPDVDPISGAWIIFGWLVFTTCLYDTFGSIFNVNFFGLFPDKFRGDHERRDAAGISTLTGTFGVALGAILPPLFIVFGNKQSYIIQGGIVIFTCLIALSLAIPGTREDQIRIDSYLEKSEESVEKVPFFKTLRDRLKQKNLRAWIYAYIFFQSVVILMIASLPYLVRYVVEMEAAATTLIMVGFLLGAIISIPIWMTISHKLKDDRKTLIIASFLMAACTVPLIFLREYYLVIIAVAFWGFSLGGWWIIQSPVLADIIDESVISTGKREEGLFNGIQLLFARAALIIQAVSFALIHTLTGFNENAPSQTELAKFGIHIHLALLPMIFIIISGLILWKLYDLTPEKVQANKAK